MSEGQNINNSKEKGAAMNANETNKTNETTNTNNLIPQARCPHYNHQEDYALAIDTEHHWGDCYRDKTATACLHNLDGEQCAYLQSLKADELVKDYDIECYNAEYFGE
jgi:hypothetical protein